MIRAVLAALVLLIAPANAQPRTELTIGITLFPDTLHPQFSGTLAGSYILGAIQRPLMVYGERWEATCVLCVEVPTLANGGAVPEARPDGSRGVAIRLSLRPDLVWGDGTPVTTDDVAFTMEAGRHPDVGFWGAEFFRRVERVEIHDRLSFTLHVDRLTYDYNEIGISLLPAHIERPRFTEDPATYERRSAYVTDPTMPGLWLGPYRPVQIVAGSHAILEPNPRWFGARPHFRRVTIRAIENTAALEANLLAGAIDYVAGEIGFSTDQAISLQRRHGERYVYRYVPSYVYDHIDVNLDNPILADLRVRQALLHAIDRAAITGQLFGGRNPVADGFLNPRDRMHADALPGWAYDPARGRALLEAAGWTEIRDRIRYNARGERLSFELLFSSGNRMREIIAQVMQSQWRRVGIDVRIRTQPGRVFFGDTLRQRRQGGLALFAWVTAPQGIPRDILHSTQIPAAANAWAGSNYMGYRNPDMDRLLDDAERELDFDRRRELMIGIQRLYAADLPVLPLFFRTDPYVMPRWLAGVEPTGHIEPSTMRIENWRAE